MLDEITGVAWGAILGAAAANSTRPQIIGLFGLLVPAVIVIPVVAAICGDSTIGETVSGALFATAVGILPFLALRKMDYV